LNKIDLVASPKAAEIRGLMGTSDILVNDPNNYGSGVIPVINATGRKRGEVFER